jgi:hypothetical protein
MENSKQNMKYPQRIEQTTLSLLNEIPAFEPLWMQNGEVVIWLLVFRTNSQVHKAVFSSYNFCKLQFQQERVSLYNNLEFLRLV